MDLSSNSEISYFSFDAGMKSMSFRISGDSGTKGFCRALIAKELVWCDNIGEWAVKMDGEPVEKILLEDQDLTSVYFDYTHSTHESRLREPIPSPWRSHTRS